MQQSNYFKETLIAGLAVVAANMDYSAVDHSVFLAGSKSNHQDISSVAEYTPVLLENEPDKMLTQSVADAYSICYMDDANFREHLERVVTAHSRLLSKLAE